MYGLMNGISDEFIKLSQSLNFSTDKKFTVLYSGNMGLAQDLKMIINTAVQLKDYDIYFKFIGEGVSKSEIELLAKPVQKKIKFIRVMRCFAENGNCVILLN